jgi:hypothetical protein
VRRIYLASGDSEVGMNLMLEENRSQSIMVDRIGRVNKQLEVGLVNPVY